jgi:signal transduction histidine kinase
MSLSMIVGPPNSGRAGEIGARLEGSLALDPVLVTPTGDHAARFERELCAGDSAVIGVSIQTFDRLTDELAAAMGAELRPQLSAAQRLALMRSVARETELRTLGGSAVRRGFAPALERLIETYRRRTGLEVDSHLAGLEPRLAEPVESALYRIAQEALTNIAKHAGASTVSIVTRRDGDRLTMVVEDNGTGFETGAPAHGLGLVSMRERVELAGGSLEAGALAGGGFRVEARLPQ